MILSGPAFKQRAMHRGHVTSTSPRLTDKDFEQFMAFIESWCGGAIAGWDRGYWARKSGDALARMRWLAQRIANTLELSPRADDPSKRLLEPDGVGLAGWISARVARGRTDRLDDLLYPELRALIDGLKDYADRHGVVLQEVIDADLRAIGVVGFAPMEETT